MEEKPKADKLHPTPRLAAEAIQNPHPAASLHEAICDYLNDIPEVKRIFYISLYQGILHLHSPAGLACDEGLFIEAMGCAPSAIALPLSKSIPLQQTLERQDSLHIAASQLPAVTSDLISPARAKALQETYGYKSIFLYPLVSRRAKLGFLGVLLSQEELPTDLVKRIEQVDSIAAATLEIDYLREQLDVQQRQKAALHTVSLRVSRSLDLEEVMQQAVEEVTNALWVEAAGISVIEPETGDLVIRAQKGLHAFAHNPVRIPKGKGIAWETLITKEPIIVKSWEDEPRLAVPEFREERVSTTILVPMLSGGEPVGVLSAMSRVPRDYTQDERDLLSSIADQVAVALVNARLHEETQRQSGERAFLFHLADSITPLQDVTGIAQESLRQTLDFLRWPIGAFLVEESESGALVPQARIGDIDALQVLIAHIREVVYQNNTLQSIIVNHAEVAPRTVVQIPLQARHRTLGWLMLGTPEAVEIPTHVKEALATEGSYLGVAVENAMLYQEMSEREQSTRALYQITRAMTGHNLTKIVEQTLTELQNGIPYQVAGVLLLNDSPLEIIRLRVHVSPERMDDIEARLQSSLGLPRKVLKALNEEARIILHCEDDTLKPGSLLSYLEVPIFQEDEPAGVILLARQRPFQAREQRLLFILAYQLNKVLGTIRLFHQTQEHARQLNEANVLLEEQETTQVELFDDVANELRTPVTFTQSYAELLLDEGLGPLNEEQKQALGVLQQQAQFLSRLVHDLGSIKVIDRQNLHCQQVALVDLLHKAAKGAQIAASKKNQTLETAIDPKLPGLWIDPERILQVVETLLSNAINFSPPGGTVSLSAQKDGEAWVRIAAKDTGPGIPQDDLPLIFKRLYHGKLGRKYPGLGIGLTLAKRIVETHGGAIGVESEGGDGSTFFIRLPIESSD